MRNKARMRLKRGLIKPDLAEQVIQPVVQEGILSYNTPDANGICASDYHSHFGRAVKHSGNGKAYTITGFAWNGETDSWNVLMREGGRLDSVTISRPLHQMIGHRKNGDERYERTHLSWD